MTERDQWLWDFKFDLTKRVSLIPTASGGWIVEQETERGCHPNLCGAFTDTSDLVRGLSAVLIDRPEKPEKGDAKEGPEA